MTNILKVEAAGSGAKRIVSNETGAIIGMALQRTDNTWGAYDNSEHLITDETFSTPNEVRAWMEKRVSNG